MKSATCSFLFHPASGCSPALEPSPLSMNLDSWSSCLSVPKSEVQKLPNPIFEVQGLRWDVGWLPFSNERQKQGVIPAEGKVPPPQSPSELSGGHKCQTNPNRKQPLAGPAFSRGLKNAKISIKKTKKTFGEFILFSD